MLVSTELKIGSLILVLFAVVVFISLPKKHQSTVPAKINDSRVFTLDEVSRHNTNLDCWIAIDNNVYNATDYLSIHPGGAQMIVPFCGRDTTDAFRGMKKHNARAEAALATIIIGSVKL